MTSKNINNVFPIVLGVGVGVGVGVKSLPFFRYFIFASKYSFHDVDLFPKTSLETHEIPFRVTIRTSTVM